MPTMSTSTVGMLKGDPVTYEELTPEHKQKFDEIKALFEADLIRTFKRTHHHDIKWKGFSPEGALDGVDLSLLSEECTRALCHEVNYMVAHSLHRHSESLVNTFERVALRVVQEIMKNQYSPTGPTLGSQRGNCSFKPGYHCLMHSRLQNDTVHWCMSCTRREETPGITHFSMSHLRKFHTGMHVHTYRTTASRYVRFSRWLGKFLGWMQISKHGWLSTPPGRAMITHTRPQKLKLWIRSTQS
jgi:hypothetical protein